MGSSAVLNKNTAGYHARLLNKKTLARKSEEMTALKAQVDELTTTVEQLSALVTKALAAAK